MVTPTCTVDGDHYHYYWWLIIIIIYTPTCTMGGDYKLVEVYPSILVPVASFCSFFQSVFYILQNPFCEYLMALINIIFLYWSWLCKLFLERERESRRKAFNYWETFPGFRLELQRFHDHLSTKRHFFCKDFMIIYLQNINVLVECSEYQVGDDVTVVTRENEQQHIKNLAVIIIIIIIIMYCIMIIIIIIKIW